MHPNARNWSWYCAPGDPYYGVNNAIDVTCDSYIGRGDVEHFRIILDSAIYTHTMRITLTYM